MHTNELLEKLKAQDRSAIEYLYSIAYQPIKYYVRKHLGRTSDVDDIFQDAILILYDKIKSPVFELTTTVNLYLLGISKNLVLRRQAKAKKMRLVSASDMTFASDINFEKEIYQREQYELFNKYFDQLGNDCKKVLGLFFKKKSMKQIGQIMGYASEGYTKKRKFNCQKKMINMIKADPLYNELTNNNG